MSHQLPKGVTTNYLRKVQRVVMGTRHQVLPWSASCKCVCVGERDLTKHPSRCPCHHVLTIVQFPDVLAHVGPPDAGVTLNIHIVAQSE